MKDMKRCIALICISFLLLNSCTKYQNITFVENDKEQFLLYQGNEYYVTSLFTASEDYTIAHKNDVELGWYYSFPFSTRFYSDTDESPDYIYTIGGDTNVYLKQGFNYQIEEFVIDKTPNVFVFSEAIIEPSFEKSIFIQYDSLTEIVIHSEKHLNLKMLLRLFSQNNTWYLALPTNEIYIISPLFLNMLKENEIIGE